MKISIIGLGYVGCVSIGMLAEGGHNVVGIDNNELKVDQINSGIATIVEEGISDIIRKNFSLGRISATSSLEEGVLASDISIICVGTPNTKSGLLNLETIFKVITEIAIIIKKKSKFHHIVVRSTVTPGTIEKIEEIVASTSGKTINVDFSVIANPEFLREGTAVKDYLNPPYIIIGSSSKEHSSKIASLYNSINAEVILTDSRTSEIIKFINNSYHALKVSFANEIGNICSSLGINSKKVMEIFCKDTILNISRAYFMPGTPYGGSCLPKDLKGLNAIAKNNNIEVPILENIERSNDLQVSRVIKEIIDNKKKKIGFSGISFKKGTDDLRYSPSVKIAETLIGKGYDIKIYDENLNLAILTGTNKVYIDEHILHLKNLLVPSLDELISESDLIVISFEQSKIIEYIKKYVDKMFLDLGRIDDELLECKNYSTIN